MHCKILEETGKRCQPSPLCGDAQATLQPTPQRTRRLVTHELTHVLGGHFNCMEAQIARKRGRSQRAPAINVVLDLVYHFALAGER